MQDRFRTKLMIVMILFSVCLSFIISYVDIERVKDKLTMENNIKLALIEENIRYSLSSVDNAMFLFDDDIAKTMKENTHLLMEKYKQNPDFTTWDFHALSEEFEMDVYILDDENQIVYTNYPDDLTLSFAECCVEFNELLHERRSTGEFYHDGMDIQQQTGGLKKFSYQGTPDKLYTIELGVDLENHDVLSRFNFLDVIKKLEKNFPMIDNISVFNDEGYRLGRAEGEVRISDSHMRPLMEALDKKTRVFIEEKSGDHTGKRLYSPYEAEKTRGSSTDRVIEITYNTNELDNTLKEMDKSFILQLWVTLGLSILASILLSIIIAKPMYLAFNDSLTGIKNRASYEIAMRKALNKRRKTGLLLLDLDNFKMVNDQFGHNTGDKLLKYVAMILSRRTPGKCTPFRLGGDEFVVLVEDLKDAEELKKIAYVIIEEIATPIDMANHQLMQKVIRMMNVSTSVGGSIVPDDGEDLEDLYKKADTALYQTKNQGKNGYTYYGDIR